MQDLTGQILELVCLAATDLPPDVEKALRESVEREEPGSAVRDMLECPMRKCNDINLSNRSGGM